MTTSTGRVNFSTREKVVSNDFLRLQDLVGFDLMENMRGMSADLSSVLEGMRVSPGAVGLSVAVDQGRAIVMRPAGPDGPEDSALRLAVIRKQLQQALAAADLTNPRLDLIEIEPAPEILEQQSRDIYNPVTGTFTPALVPKIIVPSIIGNGAVIGIVHLTTGSPAAFPVVPAFTTGRIPLAAIRVAAAAAAIAPGDVLDMRPLFVPSPLTRMHGVIDGLEVESAVQTGDFAGFNIRAGEALVDGQLVKRTGLEVVSTVGAFDANTTPAANTWYFAYLFAGRDGNGFRPRTTAVNSPLREGIVLLSHVPPTADGHPSAPVAFPVAVGGVGNRMFAGDLSSRGLYLGAIRTGAVASSISPLFRSDDWIYREEVQVNFTAGASPSTTPVSLAGAGVLPSTCRAVKITIVRRRVVSDPAQPLHTMRLRAAGSSVARWEAEWIPQASLIDTSGGLGPVVLPLGSAQEFDVELVSGGADRWLGANQVFGVHGIHDPVPRVRT